MEIKKILMLGNSGAGKKTALKHVCKNLKKTDSASYGKTIINNKKLQIFNPTGADKFKFMRNVLSKNMDGAIIFIDNTQGITNTCIRMINFVEEKNVPYVIFANKQDLNNEPLKNHPNVPILPTEAISGKGLLHGLNTLLEIMESYKEKRKIEVIYC